MTVDDCWNIHSQFTTGFYLGLGVPGLNEARNIRIFAGPLGKKERVHCARASREALQQISQNGTSFDAKRDVCLASIRVSNFITQILWGSSATRRPPWPHCWPLPPSSVCQDPPLFRAFTNSRDNWILALKLLYTLYLRLRFFVRPSSSENNFRQYGPLMVSWRQSKRRVVARLVILDTWKTTNRLCIV